MRDRRIWGHAARRCACDTFSWKYGREDSGGGGRDGGRRQTGPRALGQATFFVEAAGGIPEPERKGAGFLAELAASRHHRVPPRAASCWQELLAPRPGLPATGRVQVVTQQTVRYRRLQRRRQRRLLGFSLLPLPHFHSRGVTWHQPRVRESRCADGLQLQSLVRHPGHLPNFPLRSTPARVRLPPGGQRNRGREGLSPPDAKAGPRREGD
mmetsp:Transcript_19487/g.54200  ORF Transcript_19487/g.54200 Transcript_19487/m.54200 type:complete len:211 (+) Transcript_19487:2251-2883(+)